MTFDALIGNTKLRERLERLFTAERVPHLMLFTGPDGVGKSAFAMACAHMWIGPVHDASIERRQGYVQPDLHRLCSEGKTGMHSIASVRQALQTLSLCPFLGKRQALVIEHADRMLPTSANALLKTLEEPAPGTLIILVTSRPERMLPTICSRAQPFTFLPLTDEEVARVLEHHLGHTPEMAVRGAERAHGSVSRARRSFDETWQRRRQLLIDCALASDMPDFATITEVSREIAALFDAQRKEQSHEARSAFQEQMAEMTAAQRDALDQEIEGKLSLLWLDDVRELLSDLLGVHRDLLLVAAAGTRLPHLLIHRDRADQLMHAHQCGRMAALDQTQSIVQDAFSSVERGSPLQNALETAYLRLWPR